MYNQFMFDPSKHINDHPDLLRLDDVDEIAQEAVNAEPPMPSQDRQQQARELLKDLDDNGEDLTPWEIGFVSNLIDKDWRYFTDRQIETIQKIANRRLP